MIKTLLASISICVLCGLLAIGLWPFQRPRNDAYWLPGENGLRFGGYGTIFTTDTFELSGAKGPVSSSIEIWMKPGLTIDSNTFLAFSTAENPLQFSIHQNRSDMVLRLQTGKRRPFIVTVGDIFRAGKPIFVTITSAPTRTTVYVNGVPARTFSGFYLDKSLTGRLVIGTSPVRTDGWLGTLKGLAIYRQELTPEQVMKHFESWTNHEEPDEESRNDAEALYLFKEHSGSVVHNAARAGLDLQIPSRFSLVRQPFLKPFWSEFSFTADYFRDTFLNVVGFIPLGFFFYSFLTLVKPMRSAALATVALGLAVSLTIELLQWYLPTRHSGTTDLFTNTFGTYLGVALRRAKFLQGYLEGHSPKGPQSSLRRGVDRNWHS